MYRDPSDSVLLRIHCERLVLKIPVFDFTVVSLSLRLRGCHATTVLVPGFYSFDSVIHCERSVL